MLWENDADHKLTYVICRRLIAISLLIFCFLDTPIYPLRITNTTKVLHIVQIHNSKTGQLLISACTSPMRYIEVVMPQPFPLITKIVLHAPTGTAQNITDNSNSLFNLTNEDELLLLEASDKTVRLVHLKKQQ